MDDLFGSARNARLQRAIGAELHAAKFEPPATGRPARRFGELRYATQERWSRTRRVVGKAGHTRDKSNPRFVVTSLPIERLAARELYENHYCARCETENWIQEAQLALLADRLSAATFRTNQLRPCCRPPPTC